MMLFILMDIIMFYWIKVIHKRIFINNTKIDFTIDDTIRLTYIYTFVVTISKKDYIIFILT